MQFCYGKSKDKASQGKITITQQINSSNLSLGPRAARFARYRAGKGQPRASVTANRPWSPSRRPQPRTERGAPGAQSTQAHVGTFGPQSPPPRSTGPCSGREASPRFPSPARPPPVGAPEHEGHPVTFSSAPGGLGFSSSSWTSMIPQAAQPEGHRRPSGRTHRTAGHGRRMGRVPGQAPRRPQLPRARPRD